MVSRVAIQGIAGSYSDAAVDLFLEAGAERVCFDSFSSALNAVAEGSADYAVIPVHNSLAGRLSEVSRLIIECGLKKQGLEPLPVRHVLAAAPGAHLDEIRSVVSHKVALLQCRKFLSSQPGVRTRSAPDTASSVREVVNNGDRTSAAIGSKRAAEIYGAEVILERVADADTNITTFCLVGR